MQGTHLKCKTTLQQFSYGGFIDLVVFINIFVLVFVNKLVLVFANMFLFIFVFIFALLNLYPFVFVQCTHL